MTGCTPPPLSAYVHFPWCVRKCPYCDFNSHELGETLPETDYVQALERDLEQDLDVIQQTEICSVFLGGGTPSLFSPSAIADVLGMLDKRIPFSVDVEITMEANPGTTEHHRFKDYLAAGVNRLSLGIQSFNDRQLHTLGRIHSAEDARGAFESARDQGFTNINLDLMHGLPEQSTRSALADLEAAITLAPEHISWYQLTLEPNTTFYKYPPVLPDEDTLWDIFEQGAERLAGSGYELYEISAYSQSGRQSRHNLNYWQFGDYIGIGAGAHGKLTTTDSIIRTTRTRAPRDYLRNPGRKIGAIPHTELALEFLMNALRLREGFCLTQFERRTGLDREHLDGFLKRACARDLVATTETLEEKHVRPTPLGLRFLNDLLLLVEP